jgi:hypothetical protein
MRLDAGCHGPVPLKTGDCSDDATTDWLGAAKFVSPEPVVSIVVETLRLDAKNDEGASRKVRYALVSTVVAGTEFAPAILGHEGNVSPKPWHQVHKADGRAGYPPQPRP